jgi:hypothetical protein
MKCPVDHEQIKQTMQWYDLEYVGPQPIPAIGGQPAYVLELRNCSCCQSTLAKEVKS